MAIIPEQEPLIQSLNKDWYQPYVLGIDMLRLDVIHPVVSGNKWYKLKYNIQHAIDGGYSSILTSGGAYSNHLIAAAAAAKQYGIKSIGIIKGTYAQDTLTPTLQQCKDYGMELVFVNHEDYKKIDTDEYHAQLKRDYDNPFIIPVGGANEWGREGCETIAAYISDVYTHICVSVGTGTTLIGIRNALPQKQIVLGYAPMKGGLYLKEEIDKYLHTDKQNAYTLFDDWHCGGFGKWNDELLNFMNSFYAINKVPLDIVYTGKMMSGIQQQLQQGYFSKDSRILCIHTGGLQGNASVKEKLIY
ncbi:MAG: pyridoxal-phosphate dependent enzyme [Bacteroidetes bacterium]|nr:pyridoxal-phosphate dependent enzyme [Bacteroidota bacterium]